MYDRMRSLANLWICAREILWLAHRRPSGKNTYQKPRQPLPLKKKKFCGARMLALIVKIKKKKQMPHVKLLQLKR
jgi:hypothetical protein